MDEPVRRQLHSCDPCRKGKRRCNAPKTRKDGDFVACYNCKRWKKECTFNWLSSKEEKRRTKPAQSYTSENSATSTSDISSTASTYGVEQPRPSSQWYPVTSNYVNIPTPTDPANFPFEFPLRPQGLFLEKSGELGFSADHSGFFPSDWQIGAATEQSEDAFRELESIFNSSENSIDISEQLQGGYSPFGYFSQGDSNHIGLKSWPTPGFNTPPFTPNFCIASENAASQFARTTMKRNLIRIYHDSMENALSCWLTEHNCPYSDFVSSVLPNDEREEWGPNWSNRMCIRVCRLDRSSSSIRGRALSVEENKTADRVLHLAIMAFASQWTQHAEKGTGLSVPAEISRDERSIREYVWNEARHGLEHSTRIPSFRIIFANIIFSLTQSPLDISQDKGLDQLLDNDCAPAFMETANRQLFTFRCKFVRLVREAHPKMTKSRTESIGAAFMDESERSKRLQVDPILNSPENRNTLGLLFWLGVMFDTLSAAMYQRPLVVSDEDSQITSASPAELDSEQLSLTKTPQTNIIHKKKQDVWGEFFLEPAKLSGTIPRWPCSYEEAAAVLSEATPVKVLLYRRVTQLQTLIYRGADSDAVEEVIQKTFAVYQHWNRTYRRFMLDCVENHDFLPSRIQSWYVILDGHWHLATMLLADTLASIDNGRLGSASEDRIAAGFVSKLRTEHALTVSNLCRASLYGQNPSMQFHFHDSLNEVAFLVEPWTIVLTHSFAKAAYILLQNLDIADGHSVQANSFLSGCEDCIRALQYLGRKSDMAFMLARNLSVSLDLKLAQMS
ncbi:regulatory protein [Talaromyces pinophilus]|uniref:Regulatory protein n=1 Tax=Talaromyces pinophilus TaxID=128442 RepID=A0A6V8HBI0_TALPI|nr:regulatory protein [Talaromyces pinophilus]